MIQEIWRLALCRLMRIMFRRHINKKNKHWTYSIVSKAVKRTSCASLSVHIHSTCGFNTFIIFLRS